MLISQFKSRATYAIKTDLYLLYQFVVPAGQLLILVFENQSTIGCLTLTS